LLEELATRGSDRDMPDAIRLGAAILRVSLQDLAELLVHKFVPASNADNPRSVFDAVARDHLQPAGKGG
jgi:hypothetical protein